MCSGRHTGNQGRVKRLCHMGKRWERQIGAKRKPDLQELLSEVKGVLPAVWATANCCCSGTQVQIWTEAGWQLLSNVEIPENISCLISTQPGAHCPSTASPSWQGRVSCHSAQQTQLLNKLVPFRTVLQQPWPPHQFRHTRKEGMVGQEWLHHEEVV